MAAYSGCAEVLLHSADGVWLTNVAAPELLTRNFADAALDVIWSADGCKLLLVLKDRIVLFSGPLLDDIVEIVESDVVFATFSPQSTYVCTWKRKTSRDEDHDNLKVFRVSDAQQVASFSSKSMMKGHWPLQWTADERFAFRLSADNTLVSLLGSFAPLEAALPKIPTEHITSFWVGPGGPPYAVCTFVAKTKSKPGSASMWAFPRTTAPASSKIMEADKAQCKFSPGGDLALLEMSTDSSATSYYGDSRLFLLSVDGKTAISVPAGKEGPVHDFAWNPKGDGTFMSIVGKSPPMATLHKTDGAPCFSFGAGSFNTCIFQPQGRFVLLGGFGNMSAPAQVWDVNKCRPISAPMLADAATTVSWSACGRYVLTGTTYPRLKVDNGYAFWSYHGDKCCQSKMSVLYQVVPRPGSFPDRPASPACSAIVACIGKPPSKYVPPHMRGKVAAGSVVSELMSADNRPAEKLVNFKVPSGIVGATPVLTDSAKRRAKASAKKEAAALYAEAHAEVAEICGTAVATPDVDEDPAKELRRLQKKMKQIEELQALATSGAMLNPDQIAKLAGHAECMARITELLKLKLL